MSANAIAFKLKSGLRRCLISAMAVAMIAPLAVATAADKENIKIGVFQPVTGPFSKNGQENWIAMQIARDMINERGGVNGRQVEYVFKDVPSPSAAISEVDRVVSREGLQITAGSGLSTLALAVSQAAERRGAFHWETAGAAEEITNRGFKYTFQVGGSARLYAEAAVDLAIQDLAPKIGKKVEDITFALLWENGALGDSLGKDIRAYTKQLGIKLAYDEGYDTFITDMTAIVQQLKQVKPDIMFAISFQNDAILFQRTAKSDDFYVPVFIGITAGYSNPELRDTLGSDIFGVFVSDFAANVNLEALVPEARPIAEEFQKRYREKTSRPPAGHAVSAFSGMWGLFTEVFPKAKDFTADELREIALSLDVPKGTLPNGSGLKFTNNDWEPNKNDAGQNLNAALGVWQWQPDGNPQVFPPELATAEPILVPLPKWADR